MPDLLAAADALVHSTGGVTCLEATAAGTPVVSYGLPVGHARLNTRAMADLDLLRLAGDTDELASRCGRASPKALVSCDLRRGVAFDVAREADGRCDRRGTRRARRASGGPERGLTSCSIHPGACCRGRSGAWPGGGAVQLLLLLGIGTWIMSTDEVSAVASMILHAEPLTHVKTDQREVGIIVHARRRE